MNEVAAEKPSVTSRGLAALAVLLRHKGAQVLAAAPAPKREAESVKELLEDERRKLVVNIWGNA